VCESDEVYVYLCKWVKVWGWVGGGNSRKCTNLQQIPADLVVLCKKSIRLVKCRENFITFGINIFEFEDTNATPWRILCKLVNRSKTFCLKGKCCVKTRATSSRSSRFWKMLKDDFLIWYYHLVAKIGVDTDSFAASHATPHAEKEHCGRQSSPRTSLSALGRRGRSLTFRPRNLDLSR
jgi:hypothetical protein